MFRNNGNQGAVSSAEAHRTTGPVPAHRVNLDITMEPLGDGNFTFSHRLEFGTTAEEDEAINKLISTATNSRQEVQPTAIPIVFSRVIPPKGVNKPATTEAIRLPPNTDGEPSRGVQTEDLILTTLQNENCSRFQGVHFLHSLTRLFDGAALRRIHILPQTWPEPDRTVRVRSTHHHKRVYLLDDSIDVNGDDSDSDEVSDSDDDDSDDEERNASDATKLINWHINSVFEGIETMTLPVAAANINPSATTNMKVNPQEQEEGNINRPSPSASTLVETTFPESEARLFRFTDADYRTTHHFAEIIRQYPNGRTAVSAGIRKPLRERFGVPSDRTKALLRAAAGMCREQFEGVEYVSFLAEVKRRV